MWILFIASCIALIIGIIKGWCVIINWKSFNNKSTSADSVVRITYKQFYEFYGVNPDVWNCYEEHLYKDIPIKTSWTYKSKHWCQITFSLIDYLKYQKFLANREKMKAKSKEAEDMARFINSVQADINGLNDKIKNMTINEEKKEPQKAIVRWVDTNGNEQRVETYKW